MGYLKIIVYGLLAFIERNPIFCLFMLLLAIFAPFVFKWIGWVILGIVALLLIALGIGALRMRKMRRQMEEQMRQAQGQFNQGPFSGNPFAGGASGGSGSPFGNMGGTGGMTLEEFVRRMQAEADARQQQSRQQQASGEPKTKKSDVDSSDYVEFEEVE